MRTERHVPQGLLRDGRRGSWIMIVASSEFMQRAAVRERRADRKPDVPVPGAFYGLQPDGSEPRIFASEIIVVCSLAVVLSYLFWTLGHV